MNIRLALSRLESADARAGAARALLLFCAAGYILSLAVMLATGTSLRRWLFILLVWALFVYLPLRILLEAFQTIAPSIRRVLQSRAAIDPRRYATSASIELVVDGFFERDVLMPRIATPLQTLKAKEAAAALLRMANRTPGADLKEATGRCIGTAERWVVDLSSWSHSDAPQNIQARWAGLRALASFAALCKVLVAVDHDRADGRMSLPGPGYGAGGFLDSCLDYCDRLALEVDATPWTEPPIGISIHRDDAAAIRLAWTEYASIPPPAIDARNAFVRTLLGEGIRSA